MILGIIVLILLGVLISLNAVIWIKGNNNIEAMFNTIVTILLCVYLLLMSNI